MRRPFTLERHYAKYEHALELMLSSSDCEPLRLEELLALAGADVHELLELRLGYTETRGSRALRRAIARHYPGCTEDDVLVCNAPQEAILLAMQALVEPGDRVIVLTPCYQSLRDVAVEAGAEVVDWSVRIDGSRFAVDWDALDRALERPAKLLITNFPHNPTGLLPSAGEWRGIAERVAQHGLRWFSDEMYRGLAPRDDAELTPAVSADPRALSLWGLSKSLNLPGLRLGWLVCRDRAILAAIEQRKDWTSICSNALSEVLAVHALSASAALFARNRERIARHRQALRAFVDRHRDLLRWSEHDAGPITMCEVTRGTATELADRVRERGSALLVPSSLFSMDDRWVRVGLGRADFERALERWEAAL